MAEKSDVSKTRPLAMSGRPKHTRTGPQGGMAMSFDEIARALGTTRGAVWMSYKSAMLKLSKGGRLRQLEEIRKVAAMKGRM